jgi:hypothetical protein
MKIKLKKGFIVNWRIILYTDQLRELDILYKTPLYHQYGYIIGKLDKNQQKHVAIKYSAAVRVFIGRKFRVYEDNFKRLKYQE